MTGKLRKLLIVENEVIHQLIRSKDACRAFPFLKALRAKLSSGCGSCGGRQPEIDYASVKRALAAGTPAQLDAVKQFLQAEQLRITYRQDGQRCVQVL